MPCEAGKTLLGIAITVRIKRSTLVISNGEWKINSSNGQVDWTLTK